MNSAPLAADTILIATPLPNGTQASYLALREIAVAIGSMVRQRSLSSPGRTPAGAARSTSTFTGVISAVPGTARPRSGS
jgi:hypothetical protein